MADNFDSAVAVTLHFEGGWVNAVNDPGGETNFGISMSMIKKEGLTLQDLGIANWAPGCLKEMTVGTARALYQRLFWDRYGYGQVKDPIAATKLFDCAVNTGPQRAARMAQAAAATCGYLVAADGQLGPASYAAINSCDPRQWVPAFGREMLEFYQRIVIKNPSLQVFLKNWTHRASWGA